MSEVDWGRVENTPDRAADDFEAIRARLKELQEERIPPRPPEPADPNSLAEYC